MKDKRTLNDKIVELDKKVEWFYSDDFRLEESVEKFKQAASLALEIEKGLENLKNEIEIIAKDFGK